MSAYPTGARGPKFLDRPMMSRLRIGLPVLALTVLAAGSLLYWFRSTEASAAMATPAPIDGERAFGYLKQICDLGPHIAGSETNDRLRRLAADHFQKHGATVHEQPFDAPHPLTGLPVKMANLIASWHPDRSSRIVIGAHYDSRPFPDEERDPAKRKTPFIGANDPAAGVALLMELAHHLPTSPTAWGIDLVLFDGEELVYGGGPDHQGEYFLGSKAFAREYAESLDSGKSSRRYVAGVVVDLIGGANPRFKIEPHSLNFAPAIVRSVWGTAKKLKARTFKDQVGREVLDDHLPLINVGIPAIDVIDFDYPHWHKASDLPENCAPDGLVEVGRVLTAWLAQPPSNRRGR